MSKYVAYIDESGDPIFGEGASTTFVVCAVVYDRNSSTDLSQAMAELRTLYRFQELKSSRIRSFNRRCTICQRLLSSAPKVLTIRVEKSALYGDWFHRRGTFYKYIQRLLNHELFRIFGSLEVTIDRYGSPEYQRSFAEYLVRNLQRELFEPSLNLSSAKDSDFIQASDFLAGSIRKALEGDFPDPDRLFDIVKPAWVVRRQLPTEGIHVHHIPAEGATHAFDACIEEARRYLETHQSEAGSPKVRTLEYLYYSAIDGSNDYVYTQEILDWLQSIGLRVSEEQFRTEVTASLRDEGLIIVGTRRGIKIPRTPEDIREYVTFNVNLALPVLRRLKKALVFIAARTSLTDIEAMLGEEMRSILDDVNV